MERVRKRILKGKEQEKRENEEEERKGLGRTGNKAGALPALLPKTRSAWRLRGGFRQGEVVSAPSRLEYGRFISGAGLRTIRLWHASEPRTYPSSKPQDDVIGDAPNRLGTFCLWRRPL